MDQAKRSQRGELHGCCRPNVIGSRRRFDAFVFASALSIAALLFSPAVSQAQALSDLPRPIEGPLPPMPEERYLAEPPGIEVTPYVTGLEVIWSLDFAPDGRLFIAERAGRIRVVSADGQLDPEPWATLETDVRLEDGLLGLTLDPDFATEPWVYVYYAVGDGDERVNRVSRIRDVDGRSGEEEILLEGVPSSRIHNGGRLAFGPDEMLYITTGETGDPSISQELDNLGGKVLRITPEGEVPADNPWPGSPVWAYGIRSAHGLAFRESDGALFVADNGPSGEWRNPRLGDLDEINIIERGGNYGWPLAVGAPGEPEYVDPLLVWVPATPPGDLIFYDADLMPELRGDLFMSTLSAQALFRIQFGDSADPNRVTAVDRWFHDGEADGSLYGRLRGMAVGPDGALYLGTGNHDGRASLREGDDQVLRIAPAN